MITIDRIDENEFPGILEIIEEQKVGGITTMLPGLSFGGVNVHTNKLTQIYFDGLSTTLEWIAFMPKECLWSIYTNYRLLHHHIVSIATNTQ